jgi:hypothetical protein
VTFEVYAKGAVNFTELFWQRENQAEAGRDSVVLVSQDRDGKVELFCQLT